MNQTTTLPSAKTLTAAQAAERVFRKDADFYNFSTVAFEGARDYMGWTDLASNPPVSLDSIQQFADRVVAQGVKTVMLVGEGGSIQAPMTLAAIHEAEGNRVRFIPMDSVSPTYYRHVMESVQPSSTLVIVASKSGGTIEPNVVMSALWEDFSRELGDDAVSSHFVAITDPGSGLESLAKTQDWLGIFSGEPTVGGRFSALSVFGLLPAALIGIPLDAFIAAAREAQDACCVDDEMANPAVRLAAFLYDNARNGRDKFSLLTPARAHTLCLWIEQLVAESTGKEGKGIYPNFERDPELLFQDNAERCLVVYHMDGEATDTSSFESSLGVIDDAMPRMDFCIENTLDIAAQFVIWEYATAFMGWLMKVCPFDQPDVASAKAKVLEILVDGKVDPAQLPAPVAVAAESDGGPVAVYSSEEFSDSATLPTILARLVNSMDEGDYFSINAFLPYCGHGRLAALERMRHHIADVTGHVTSLEVGPRYLHSIGQLHKGGPNTGVFLILSAEEDPDVKAYGQKAVSLGMLQKAQAAGDFAILSERGRRCVHIHLPNTALETYDALANLLCDAVS